MAKLIILRGVSGSGKSTWARNQTGAMVVSRDTLRVALFGSDGPDYYAVDKDVLSQREQMVTIAEHGMINEALRSGTDVILDNTNIEWKFVKGYAKRAQKLGAEVEIKVFDVPLSTALGRNKMRSFGGGRNVPEDVIRKQHQRFQGNKDKQLDPVFIPKPYNGTPGMPAAVLVDIDNTLAIMGDRSPYDWSRVDIDTVNEPVQLCVHALHDAGYKIIVMSGRDGACKEITSRWLDKHVQYDALFMREPNDNRPDGVVKPELFDKFVRDNYNVVFCLDDRDSVVKVYRDMGLTVFQVNYGDF